MLKNDNKMKAPEVKFTFKDEEKSEEERKKIIKELLKQRNELLKSFGFIRPDNKTNEETSDDYSKK